MATQTPQIRSLYRRILRELPSRSPQAPARTAHQKLSSPSPIQQRIRARFSNSTSASSAATKSPEAAARSQISQAEQFIQYLQAQRMYATLIERYNPGMGMAEDERVRLTARRVGMDMPEEWYGKK